MDPNVTNQFNVLSTFKAGSGDILSAEGVGKNIVFQKVSKEGRTWELFKSMVASIFGSGDGINKYTAKNLAEKINAFIDTNKSSLNPSQIKTLKEKVEDLKNAYTKHARADPATQLNIETVFTQALTNLENIPGKLAPPNDKESGKVSGPGDSHDKELEEMPAVSGEGNTETVEHEKEDMPGSNVSGEGMFDIEQPENELPPIEEQPKSGEEIVDDKQLNKLAIGQHKTGKIWSTALKNDEIDQETRVKLGEQRKEELNTTATLKGRAKKNKGISGKLGEGIVKVKQTAKKYKQKTTNAGSIFDKEYKDLKNMIDSSMKVDPTRE